MPERRDYEDYIGTCQYCFGEWKVASASGHVAVHGYLRPGDGYIHNVCRGSNERPFEHAHELADATLQEIDENLAHFRTVVQALENDETMEILEVERRGSDQFIKNRVLREHPDWARAAATCLLEKKEKVEIFRIASLFFRAQLADWTRKPVVGIDVPETGKRRTIRAAFDAKAEIAAERAADERRKALEEKATRHAAWKAERKALRGLTTPKKPRMRIKVGLAFLGGDTGRPHDLDEMEYGLWSLPAPWKAAVNWFHYNFSGVKSFSRDDVDIRPMFGLSKRDFLYVVLISADEMAKFQQLVPSSQRLPTSRNGRLHIVDVNDRATPWWRRGSEVPLDKRFVRG